MSRSTTVTGQVNWGLAGLTLAEANAAITDPGERIEHFYMYFRLDGPIASTSQIVRFGLYENTADTLHEPTIGGAKDNDYGPGNLFGEIIGAWNTGTISNLDTANDYIYIELANGTAYKAAIDLLF